MARLVIVANRVPNPDENGNPRAGGLAVALADALVPGTMWLGWSGERAAATATVPRVVEDHDVTYAMIDLGETDYREYYLGFSNGTLWPLLHMMPGLTTFHREDYVGYRAVNQAYAQTLAGMVDGDDLIWIHDYQLMTVAAELRALGINNRIGFFLHIPFPPPEILQILPPAKEVLRALCANDVIGFQTEIDRTAFLACIKTLLEVEPLPDGRFHIDGHHVRTIVTPIGIDSEGFSRTAGRAVLRAETRRMTDSLSGRALMIGVDRLDYTKGLPERFNAYNRFLASYPQHRRKVSYLQIAALSRSEVEHYNQLRNQLDHKVGEINGIYSDFDWVPLRYMTRAASRSAIAGLYRVARIGLVTPLRDGMNLVAKEYVAAQNPADPGVLILSRFAGAAADLTDAILVNPFDVDEVASAINIALTMSQDERQSRHDALLTKVYASSAEAYCTNFLAALRDVRPVSPIELRYGDSTIKLRA